MAERSSEEMRQAFEDALVANPDDLATHRAYADWLADQGDPRGEFIQVQLSLEQAADAQRDALLDRESKLLEEHQSEWLGVLDYLLFNPDNQVRFRRGWLDEVQVSSIRAGLSGDMAGSPGTRLLRRLAVVKPDAEPLDLDQAYQSHVMAGVAWFEEEEEQALLPLLESLYLGNVREFQLGDERERCDAGDDPLLGLLQKMPKLEELKLFLWRMDAIESIFALPLSHLRLLHLGGVFDYPLEILAANETLTQLEDLLIQPAAPNGHSKLWPEGVEAILRSPNLPALRSLALRFILAGDGACGVIAESGLVKRLTTLDLQYCDITDEGANLLAAADGLANLAVLDVRGNRISDEGIARLIATGVPLEYEPQLGPRTEDDPDPEGDGDGDEFE